MNLTLPYKDKDSPNWFSVPLLTNINEKRHLYIIGGNGSGKTRLGILLEDSAKQQGYRTIRIAAQKVLSIPPETLSKSLENLENELFIDTRGRLLSYNLPYGQNHVTSITNDYDKILSKLFTLKTKRDSEYYKFSKMGLNPSLNDTPIDIIQNIWNELFNGRSIIFDDNKVTIEIQNQNGGTVRYSGNEMSDGERGTLYILAHALCCPANSLIIFDEPESHIHKSLLIRLWNRIEEHCADKHILVITHDLDLIASRKSAVKIWIKEFFGGNRWDWEFIGDNQEIPEELFIELLGSKKQILFIESVKNSTEHLIFQEVYPDYYVVPCGSCEKVIHMVKSLNENSFWQTYKGQGVFTKGIIDRDYRSESDVEYLLKNNIYVLPVSEIENLLSVPEIIKLSIEDLGFPNIDDKLNLIKERIVNFSEQNIEEQGYNQYKRNIFEKFKTVLQGKKEVFTTELHNFQKEQFDLLLSESIDFYKNVVEKKDIELILKHFNNKGIVHQISSNLGINNYKEYFLRVFMSKSYFKSRAIAILKGFLPTF